MQAFNLSDARAFEVLALGDLLEAYGGPQLALRTLKSGGDAHKFMTAMAERIKSQPTHSAADRALGFDSTEVSGYSITRAIRAAHMGDWKGAGLERDLSNLATTKTDRVPNGFFVPLGLMNRDFNVGTASEAGNMVGTVLGGDRTVDPIRKVSVLASMGAVYMSGLRSTLEIPRFTSSSAAAWSSEVGAATTITEATEKVSLTPKRAVVQMVMSKQAVRQATPALDIAISRHLIAALIELIERDGINGDGTSNSLVGVRSTTNVGAVVGGTNGAQLDFTHLSDMEKAADLANCPVTDNAGFIVNAATKRWLRTKAIGTSLPYIWTGGDRPLLGYRTGVSNILPSNLSKGGSGAVCSSLLYSSDWSQLLIGMYGGGVDIVVDHITAAPTGQVKITAMVEVGIGVLKPTAFAKMDDALTA